MASSKGRYEADIDSKWAVGYNRKRSSRMERRRCYVLKYSRAKARIARTGPVTVWALNPTLPRCAVIMINRGLVGRKKKSLPAEGNAQQGSELIIQERQ